MVPIVGWTQECREENDEKVIEKTPIITFFMYFCDSKLFFYDFINDGLRSWRSPNSY